MSTTISTTEQKTVSPRAVTKLKTEEKPRLVRSSSIEKIRRFNTFICSHQYYILPALLSWLKSSQSGLQASTEKTIHLFRSVLFHTYFYKLYQRGLRSVALSGYSANNLRRDIASVLVSLYRRFTECLASALLAVLVYGACVLVLCQFFVALYLMYLAFLPYGFIFMVGCMTTINYLCYRTMFYFLRNGARRDAKNK